jgi:hypothetical protein
MTHLLNPSDLGQGLGMFDDWAPSLAQIDAVELQMQRCNNLAQFKVLRQRSAEMRYARIVADHALNEVLGVAPATPDDEVEQTCADAQTTTDQFNLDVEKMIHVALKRTNLWETAQSGFAFSTENLPWPATKQ